jgi:hypothetical protein
MAAAMTTFSPYQPVQGVPIRDSLAHAHDHIERTERFLDRAQKATSKILEKHEALKGAVERIGNGKKKLGMRALATGVSGSVAAIVGVADGRYGGEKGHLAKWGIPLDWAVAAAGHTAGVAALALTDNEMLEGVLHAVGDAGFIVGSHRWGRELGVAWAQKAAADSPTAAAANANGVKGGTVYTVAHPK